jgi:N-acetylgalactosamine-6-sulfatase
MTGQYPARWGVHQHFAHPSQNRERGMPDWLDPRAPTLPRLLRSAGYRTGHFGKWHLTNRQTPGAPRPEAYGIDESAVFNGGAGWPAAKVGETAANAVAFIRANRARPFFLNVWLHEAHTPHSPSAEAMARWQGLDEQKQVYAAVITDGDNAVGRILDALREAGVDGNTLVIFSSDNGPENTGKVKRPAYTEADSGVTGYDTYYSVGETGGLRGRKRSLFEGGVRVPFIVRWPGRATAGLRDDTTVITAVDLLPTLCAAAGVTPPADYRGDGENLLPSLLGRPTARTKPVFWEWRGNQTEPDWWPRLAVRDGDWKLLLTYDAKRVSLHRLPADRAESQDVSTENPAVVARLSQLALAWKASLPANPPPGCSAPAEQLAPQPAAKKARSRNQ